MTAREQGFLLLTSHLGIPERRVLTQAKLRQLSQRMASMEVPAEDRELGLEDLLRLGYGPDMAVQILSLLNEGDILEHYLYKGKQQGCVPITRISREYPQILRARLGGDCPGCLWIRGDTRVLDKPGIALVGSRDLEPANHAFAEAVGIQAARQGLTLISGNARGADRTAQEACLESGGQVISIVADRLDAQPLRKGILYVSQDGYDLPFSPQRALSRNRVIHAWGRIVFVAQARLGSGGTWDGTARNLRHGWSSVACFRDGSEAAAELEQLGAFQVDEGDLSDLTSLLEPQMDLFHRQ